MARSSANEHAGARAAHGRRWRFPSTAHRRTNPWRIRCQPSARSRLGRDLPTNRRGSRRRSNVIVLYCSAGVRSCSAAASLIRSGLENVFNLQGSIFQWANERRPVIRDGKAVNVVHPYDHRWGVLLDSELHPGAGDNELPQISLRLWIFGTRGLKLTRRSYWKCMLTVLPHDSTRSQF